MLRSGYAATGLVELLREAGVPKGSFYNHFESKEAFGLEVVRRYYAAHDHRLAALAGATERSALERLRAYFDYLLAIAERAAPDTRGCLLGMLALEMAGSSEPVRALVDDCFTRWQARVAELLRQAQDAGELGGEPDVQRLAGMLLQGWEGALMRARVSQDPEGLHDFIAFAFTRLLDPNPPKQERDP